MKKETLEKEYLRNMLTYQQIADKYDMCIATVWYYMKKYDISPLKHYERLDLPEFNEEQNDLMIGTMLGDGCLQHTRLGGSAFLVIKHSSKFDEYVTWKYNILGEYAKPIKYWDDNYNGKIYGKCEFRTICHPIFTSYHKLFYDNGVKVVTNEVAELLTPMALAVWFMDDGCGSVNSFEMSTHSFTEPELHRLQSVLLDRYGLHTSLWFAGYMKGNNQKKYKLAILKKSTQKLYDIVFPYIVDCMKYKLRFIDSGASETTSGAPQFEGEDIVQTLE